MDVVELTRTLYSLHRALDSGPPFAERLPSAGNRTWTMVATSLFNCLREYPSRTTIFVGGKLPFVEPAWSRARTSMLSVWQFCAPGDPLHSQLIVPLAEEDPLSQEDFLLVRAGNFSFILCYKRPLLQFSFEPAVVARAQEVLRQRLVLSRPDLLTSFNRALETQPVVADRRLLSAFGRRLIEYGALTQESVEGNELDFLELLSHEIRTPLTTIRTLTRLLLKRSELAAPVRDHLEAIDRECNQQIERFELFSMAVDHQQGELALHPQAVAVDHILLSCLERWRKQADERGLALEVDPLSELPTIQADRLLLERVLSGLVDRLVRGLPVGSHIQMRAERAGLWLRVRIWITGAGAQNAAEAEADFGGPLHVESQTGTVTLRLPTAQGLVAAMGGKLTLRMRPDRESSTLTLYLPIQPLE